MNKNLSEQNPLISIGMPIYNEQSHLRKTLDSVLSQDYQNFELIISDNCSDDGTGQLCEEYAAKDDRIRYYRNHINIGSIDNFAKVFELSQGDYFVFICGHDIWDKQFLSSCLEILLQDSSVILCHPQSNWIDTDDQNLGVIGGSLETRGLSRISRFQMVLWGVVYADPIFGIIRTSALKKATLGLKAIAPDIILLAELSLIGTFAYIPKPLLYVRRMQDYGSWEIYIKKIFNQNMSEFSASELFWQMTFQYAQIINKQLDEGLEKDILISLLPACLLTKYNWILTGLSATNAQSESGDIDFNHRILDLDNALKQSIIQFKKLLAKPSVATELIIQEQISQETTKKILIIDGVFFQLYKTGIARVWTSLLEEWATNGFAQHIIVLDRAETAPKIAGVWYRTVPAYDYNNTDSDRQMLQQVCEEEGVALFISTYYTTPTNTPSVFMAYDMIPEVFGANFDEPMWREKHNGIRHASAYITISKNTAQDLVKYSPAISSDSVTVAHCGINKTFSPANLQEINLFKTKYGISKSYFILVGASTGYKNIELFLQAFAQLATKQSFEVVITSHGILPSYEFRSYTSGSNVHILHLSDEELRLAYAGAIALVYPSKYEGFGL
ncbi:MAG: glycosyltransferase, partial [Pseudanabaena sp.]